MEQQLDDGFPCSGCKKNIPDGTSMWSINLNHETCVESVVTVHLADYILIYCEECASTKDFRKIIVPEKKSSLQ